MIRKHEGTKTQRHKEDAQLTNSYARLLCAFVSLCLSVLTILARAQEAYAQGAMPGMENSVGYLSSGTSLEPKNTSEFGSMIHTSLGNWTFMFHANVFLVDIQQTGPRGRDKFASGNWA